MRCGDIIFRWSTKCAISLQSSICLSGWWCTQRVPLFNYPLEILNYSPLCVWRALSNNYDVHFDNWFQDKVHQCFSNLIKISIVSYLMRRLIKISLRHFLYHSVCKYALCQWIGWWSKHRLLSQSSLCLLSYSLLTLRVFHLIFCGSPVRKSCKNIIC